MMNTVVMGRVREVLDTYSRFRLCSRILSISLLAQALLEGGDRAIANFFHARHQFADVAASLPHFLGGGCAFALAAAIEDSDGFGGGFKDRLGYGFAEFLLIARAEHAGNAQGAVQVGLRIHCLEL